MGIIVDPSSCANSSASVKLTSQMLGFLSVLAISGSVALLSLSKDKIWNYVFEEENLASESSSSSPFQASGNIRTLPKSTSEGRRNAGNARKMMKKVRFAADVVDPTTDGKEYRKRWMEGQKEGEIEREREREAKERRWTKEMQANRRALYEGLKRSRMQYGSRHG